MPPALQLRIAARNVAQQSSKSIRRPCKRKLHLTSPLSAPKPSQDGGESGSGPFGVPVAIPATEFRKFLEKHTSAAPQERDEKENQSDGAPDGDEPPSEPEQAKSLFHGSALRRRQRANLSKDAQTTGPRQAPPWFLDWNVHLVEEQQGLPLQESDTPVAPTLLSDQKSSTQPPLESADIALRENRDSETKSIEHQTKLRERQDKPNTFDVQVRELEIIARGHLRLPAPDMATRETPFHIRPHLILSHPDNSVKNSISPEIWRKVIEDLARTLDCDLLVLDAQDIGELIASAGLGDDITSEAMKLSYEISAKIQKACDDDSRSRSLEMTNSGGSPGEEWKDDDSDDNEGFEAISMDGPNSPFGSPMIIGKPVTIDITKMLQSTGATRGSSRKLGGSSSFMSALFDNDQSRSGSKHENHILSGVVNSVLAAATVKRSKYEAAAKHTDVHEDFATSSSNIQSESCTVFPSQSSSMNPEVPRKKLIIYIQSIHALEDHSLGQQFLSELYEQVQRRRNSGQEQIVIGAPPFLADAARARWYEGSENASNKVLLTPPDVAPQDISKLMKGNVQHATAANYRNLRTMLQTKWNTEPWQSFSPRSSTFLKDVTRTASMPETSSLWRIHYVQRLAAVIWGTLERDPDKEPSITEAIAILEQSDCSKTEWLQQRTRDGPHRMDNADEARMGKLRSSATKHEKALLGSVIEPSKLSVTFKDVHAPFETIEAIQTLTTLSLVRPEAFSYGVLASDRLPGLLLYGPPGTGKTLLAKAVAKESGAAVLSVSSAQLNDMYVGEGEKNVAALFSLAKKLTPCVIFLDEADAIFSARGNRGSRVNHRELLNQFLTEWDGMSNDASGAFIMVATNRPMDLDDAVLRRLPRRLLVDLPTESDRLAILKIHLRGEVLADDVDLASLAKNTPFYSGSDLKNLAVAAALECVRGENEAAKNHNGEEAYKHAEKRTVTAQHFEKALSDISASISEDMTSLRDIKKFDEQYGDKRGKKRKQARWGFSTPAEADTVLDTIKVRS